MPTVTFLGPHYARRYPDGYGEFIRNKPVTMTQAWVDQYRGHLPAARFRIDGDEAPTMDEGLDGIPDKSWRVADIRTWLDGYNMNPTGYATKRALLQLVDDALNPTKAEEVIVEAEEQAEVPAEESSDASASNEQQGE